MQDNKKQVSFEPAVLVNEDKLGRLRFTISIFKGQSLAMEEEFQTGKLIMFRLKVIVKDDLSKYTDMPKLFKVFIDIVESMDVDLKLLEKFFRDKWSQEATVKYFSHLLDVYEIVKVDEKIGEIDMDYDTFKSFVSYLRMLSFETFKTDRPIA